MYRLIRKQIVIHIVILLVLFCVGCSLNTTPPSDTSAPTTISINSKTFSIEEINNGIINVFHTDLYYHPDGFLHHFLNKIIEYELYFSPAQDASFPNFPKIYIVTTNVEHPSSTEQASKLHKFAIHLTEYGLQSYFYAQYPIDPQENYLDDLPAGTVYLGHYSMNMSQIPQPVHEKMSDQWKQRAETAIRLYMDENDFCVEDGKNLQTGKYNIYIQGFSESDVDSTIIFEHENGQVYIGRYYFVHNITEGETADLNHVELIEDLDTEYVEYLDKLKQNAALHMQYSVKVKPEA